MKKGKGSGGGKFFQGKETFQRMNFLYQAAHVTLAQSSKCNDLPAYYGNAMVAIARKSVLKIEPNIKRDVCKGCGNLLKPGVTARIRIRPGKLICTCLRCGTIKRFPTTRGYKLWTDRNEACLEVLEIPSTRELPHTEVDGNSEDRPKIQDSNAAKGKAKPNEKQECMTTSELVSKMQS